MGKWPNFEYHVGKWLKYDRFGSNSSQSTLGSPLNLGDPWRPLATLGDHRRHAWKWTKCGCLGLGVANFFAWKAKNSTKLSVFRSYALLWGRVARSSLGKFHNASAMELKNSCTVLLSSSVPEKFFFYRISFIDSGGTVVLIARGKSRKPRRIIYQQLREKQK